MKNWTLSTLAFVLHRLSGLGLAIFLPLHFLVLGLAIDGEASLDSALVWSQQPLVKFAEWGLVMLLALHLGLGLRLLAIEWLPWVGHLRHGLVIGAMIAAFLIGLIFLGV